MNSSAPDSSTHSNKKFTSVQIHPSIMRHQTILFFTALLILAACVALPFVFGHPKSEDPIHLDFTKHSTTLTKQTIAIVPDTEDEETNKKLVTDLTAFHKEHPKAELTILTPGKAVVDQWKKDSIIRSLPSIVVIEDDLDRPHTIELYIDDLSGKKIFNNSALAHILDPEGGK